MDNLSTLYQLVYGKHFKNCIDTNNAIHNNVKNVLLGQKVENKSFENVIQLLEQKASLELTGKVIDNLNKGILDDFYFAENKLEINQASIDEVVKKRRITNIELNKTPLTNPFKQLLITSNIMLTLPKDYDNFEFNNKHLINMNENQENWYDHPIPLDIRDEANEIIYGLVNLSQAVKVETVEKVAVLLSVSVTHKSLNKIAKEYIRSKLHNKNISNLDIYIFTQDKCNELTFILDKHDKNLQNTLGVDGKYGKHYTFLKAVAPLFKQVMNPEILATFKIDLDQVFPQKELAKATGKFAFQNFKSNRWGAQGIDCNGRKVRLSMAAGALVNESDINDYIFTPDVKAPSDDLNIEQIFFNSAKPQYISTVSEISKQYKSENECIIRYHITGGVNGILIDDLMKFRPFTPSFFTRAEDQGYMLSVINKEVNGEYMRCAHLDKFVMRHDKQAFLSDSLEQFEIPKSVGDFERMLIFSHYSYDILGCGDYIKQELYPFTGCFILKRPYTAVLLRTLARLTLLNEADGKTFLNSFAARITELINSIDKLELKNTYIIEKNAFDRYYDLLKTGINDCDKNKLRIVFESTKIA